MKRAAWLLAGAAALALALSGCAQVGYLAQAAGGQLDLLVRQRPLDAVLSDPATPPAEGMGRGTISTWSGT